MSASLVIREMHIKAIMRYPAHLLESPRSRNLTPPDAGEDVEQQELSSMAGENAKWHGHSGRQSGSVL